MQNAYNAYLKIKEVNPYSLEDLKMIHGILTHLIVKDSGTFRRGGEGVFDENGNCIFICPPPEQVDLLMKQLFDFLKVKKDEIHPLILSSIFHYEFVFIHPFSDGNGRCARLWQNVILTNWEALFEYVPIEFAIMKYQKDYYQAIQNCNNKGDSTEFIEFMLKMIDEVLDGLIEGVNKQVNHVSIYVKKLLDVMESGVTYTALELMNLLNLKSRISFRENYLNMALDNGLIKMSYPTKATSKNQTYYKD